MKTEQQVKEWLEGKTFSKNDATEIRIHLIRAFGDWDKAWYVGERGTKFTYPEFIKWFSQDICESQKITFSIGIDVKCCDECKFKNDAIAIDSLICRDKLSTYDINIEKLSYFNEPKFKVGDWVIADTGDILNIYKVSWDDKQCEYRYFDTIGYMYCFESVLKKWTPEYGDICWAKGIYYGEFIYINGIKSGAFIDENIHYLHGVVSGSDHDTIRPATSEEKQLLFDILDKNGKVWDEKEKCLRDKPKSLKEQWEKYYRENHLGYFGLGDKKHGAKMVAIEQLLLCGKFCNDKFKSGSYKWGIYIFERKYKVTESRNDVVDISDIFTSKLSAEMTIELLDEDTILTALSSDY